MIKPEITEMVRFLNELLNYDREAIQELVNIRVNCNDALANHPTVQVMGSIPKKDNKVGLLGILNGYLGIYDDGYRKNWGALSAVFDDESGELLEFRILENE